MPLVPFTPDVPFTPEVPLIPDVPDSPDVPSLPDVPPVPFVPFIPDVPLIPEVPLIPLVPSLPEVPEVPLNIKDDVVANVALFPAPPTQTYPSDNDAVNAPLADILPLTLKLPPVLTCPPNEICVEPPAPAVAIVAPLLDNNSKPLLPAALMVCAIKFLPLTISILPLTNTLPERFDVPNRLILPICVVEPETNKLPVIVVDELLKLVVPVILVLPLISTLPDNIVLPNNELFPICTNEPVCSKEPVTTKGPVFTSTVPKRVCTSSAASPNWFEPDEYIIDAVSNCTNNLEAVIAPVTLISPVTFNVLPSKVKLLSTLALPFGL